MKKSIYYFLFTLIFFISFAGIFRHDVKERKYLALGQQKQFECVRQVFLDTAFSGSAVLISERFALSAAHIFIESDYRYDTIIIDGNTVILNTPINERVANLEKISIIHNGERIKAKKLILHPNYLDSLTKGTCDIALIELEKSIKKVTFPNMNLAFDELNSNVIGVGYGGSGPANQPELITSKQTKIGGENVIDLIEGDKYLNNETLLSCDFDHPTRTDCNKMGNAKPMPLEYIVTGGDSGGGLFRKKRNTWELVGICSNGGVELEQFKKSGYYGQTMSWTRISTFQDWITNNIR